MVSKVINEINKISKTKEFFDSRSGHYSSICRAQLCDYSDILFHLNRRTVIIGVIETSFGQSNKIRLRCFRSEQCDCSVCLCSIKHMIWSGHKWYCRIVKVIVQYFQRFMAFIWQPCFVNAHYTMHLEFGTWVLVLSTDSTLEYCIYFTGCTLAWALIIVWS